MSKYKVFEKFNYKDFSIVFCTYNKNPDLQLSYVRNSKWEDVDFICFEDHSFHLLKERVREFLKNPDLSSENIKKTSVKVFYKPLSFKTNDEHRNKFLSGNEVGSYEYDGYGDAYEQLMHDRYDDYKAPFADVKDYDEGYFNDDLDGGDWADFFSGPDP